jgi:phospholipase/carboxylesterase
MFQPNFCASPIPENPKNLVILLHGYGSNGENISIIADAWRSKLPDTVFYAPNAPMPHPEVRGGYQWCPLESRDAHILMAESEKAFPVITDHIRSVQKHFGIGWDRTAIVGFSQGCYMGLATALHTPQLCRALVGYSGGLHYAVQDIKASPQDWEALLVHGTYDTVVPFSASQDAQKLLQQASFNCGLILEPGLDHTISYEGLQKGLEFLQHLFQGVKHAT